MVYLKGPGENLTVSVWQRVGAETEKVLDRVRRNEHKNGKSKFTCKGACTGVFSHLCFFQNGNVVKTD